MSTAKSRRRHRRELLDLHLAYITSLVFGIVIGPIVGLFTWEGRLIMDWVKEYKFMREIFIRENNRT
jgi:H+/Cl- antiporter ClcA